MNYESSDDLYRFTVSTSADSPFIETTSLRENSFSKSNGIRIAFIDNTECTSVTCYYKIGNESEYSEQHSCTVEVKDATLPENNIISCILPITESDVTNFRIVFKGCKTDGDITILTIMPASAVTGHLKTYGSIEKL